MLRHWVTYQFLKHYGGYYQLLEYDRNIDAFLIEIPDGSIHTPLNQLTLVDLKELTLVD